MAMDFEGIKQPYSLEAEQSVLGAVIIDPPAIESIVGIVQPQHFYLPQHQTIFSKMLLMFELGKPIDAVTLLEEIKKSDEYDDASGKQYILQLASIVPTSRHIESYAKIVRDKFYLRSIIEASRTTIEDASEATTEAETIIDAAEQRILDIRSGKSTELRPVKDVITETMDRISKLASADSAQYAGLSTGFATLDRVITGLNRSDLIILAARPGVGKTSFALNIAQNVALGSGKNVVMFSLEMSSDQLVSRMLSTESLVDSQKMRTGDISPDEWTRLASAVSNLYNIPMYVDDSAGITVTEMKAKLRRIKDVGLVVVDYLQLLTSSRRSESRVNEVSEITRNLKVMAKELDVPLLVLSQLSRDVEKRKGENTTPMLSDLRESGSIEQDADIVIFLHRDSAGDNPEDRPDILDIKVIVAKNRHGGTTALPFKFTGRFTKFSSVDFTHVE